MSSCHPSLPLCHPFLLLLCVCSFGVLMLVVLTGRSPHTGDGERNGHILRWADDCISSKRTDPLKDPSMDAPDDAVLRLAQLALRCTVQRTASRPNMADIANELQGIRHEVVGKEELSAAVKVDEQAEGMRTAATRSATAVALAATSTRTTACAASAIATASAPINCQR
ncbi:unnamed protein product [Closterium sp. Naga37s-1]|nr:unnamed protein product [Closterium sp. Naga37s-1]